jgi:hypothetical protein
MYNAFVLMSAVMSTSAILCKCTTPPPTHGLYFESTSVGFSMSESARVKCLLMSDCRFREFTAVARQCMECLHHGRFSDRSSTGANSASSNVSPVVS